MLHCTTSYNSKSNDAVETDRNVDVYIQRFRNNNSTLSHQVQQLSLIHIGSVIPHFMPLHDKPRKIFDQQCALFPLITYNFKLQSANKQ